MAIGERHRRREADLKFGRVSVDTLDRFGASGAIFAAVRFCCALLVKRLRN